MHEGQKLPFTRWHTKNAHPIDRYEAWQESLNSSHLAWHLEGRPPEAFEASCVSTNIDELRLVDCSCDPCRGRRDSGEINKESDSYFGLLMILAGCEEVTVGSKTLCLEPGMGLLWDSTEAIRFRLLSPIHKLTVFFRQKRLLSAAPNARDWLAAPLNWRRGTGAVTGAHIRAISNEAPHIDVVRAPSIAETLMHLVSGEFDEPEATTLTSSQRHLLSRAQACLETNLEDPALGPHFVATELGISVRSLHLLYSRKGTTLSRCILERRLERCRVDLVRQPHRTITEIAFRWGFNDAAHFSRSFRRRYGETASGYRARFVS